MIFWIFVAGLLGLVLLLLIVPILRAPKELNTSDRQQQNIQIAREKKSQLDSQLQQGELQQAEYDEALKDLERALALDLERNEIPAEQQGGKWAVWIVALLVPVLSIGLYMEYGEYRVIENPALAQAEPSTQDNVAANHENMSIEAMMERLKQRLQDNPEDAEGWYIMGRTMMAMQQIDQAVTAFQRTYDLVGEDASVMYALADALALQNNGSMAGEPEQLVEKAMKLSPQDPTGMWLAGLAAEQRKDYKSAHEYWRRMLPLIATDAEATTEVNRLLALLEKRDPTIESVVGNQTAAAVASIKLSVDLDASVRDRAAPGDAVFIYAKAMQGPPMPLAVKKLTVQDLPVNVSLSDADAMMAGMKLSSFDQVIVGARVSKSGNPVAQPGDLFVEQGAIDSKNPPADLRLVINQVK